MPAASTPVSPITVEDLQRLPLLSSVASADLRLLLQVAPTVGFRRGEFLMHQDQAAERAWLLVDGTVRVQTHAEGRQHELATVEPGTLLGEAGLLAQAGVHTASVVAAEPVRVLLLERRTMAALKGSAVLAVFQVEMLQASARRLRRTQKAMNTLLIEKRSRAAAAKARELPREEPPPGVWRSFLQALGALS